MLAPAQRTWKLLTDLPGNGANAHSLAFDPTGRRLALGAYNHQVQLYQLPAETGEPFPGTQEYARHDVLLKGHGAPITGLAFTP